MKHIITVAVICGFLIVGCVSEQANIDKLRKPTGVVFNDVNGNGIKDNGEAGIANVGVSNGRDVVTTDGQGRYELEVSDDCIIFVIKPAGWKTPIDKNNLPKFYYIHKPAGSPENLAFAGIETTGPKPESIDFGLQKQQESDKFNVIVLGDIQANNKRDITYARRQFAEMIPANAAFGISLGDNVGNDISQLNNINEAVAVIGLPWYNTAGNHDMNFLAAGDAGSLDTFKSIYGPVNYSFNYGKVHFIILDSIIAKRTDDKHLKYDEGLGDEELSFIANDLKFVSKDKLIVLLMHGGLHSFGAERDRLFEILKDFDQSLSIAGHYHVLGNYFYGKKDNFYGKKEHHYYVAGAVCGAWWQGTLDPFLDVPHSMMIDGAPSGYSILSLDGNEYSLKYKAFGKADDFQMTIYAPDEVKISEIAETKVTANVFAASEKAVVKMKVDDMQWAVMEPSKIVDQHFVKMRKWEDEHQINRVDWAKNPKAIHIWQCDLPKNLSEGMHVITVKSTDMFGRSFDERRIIKVIK